MMIWKRMEKYCFESDAGYRIACCRLDQTWKYSAFASPDTDNYRSNIGVFISLDAARSAAQHHLEIHHGNRTNNRKHAVR